jgi:hypothetical protein
LQAYLRKLGDTDVQITGKFDAATKAGYDTFLQSVLKGQADQFQQLLKAERSLGNSKQRSSNNGSSEATSASMSTPMVSSGIVGVSAGASGGQVLSSDFKSNPNFPTIMTFLINQMGLTPAQAAGIAGNLMQESTLSPTSSQAGGPGRGIAQWSVGGRWDTSPGDNLMEFISKNGGDPIRDSSNLTWQLRFMKYELNGPYSQALGEVRRSQTSEEAAGYFARDYEQCGVMGARIPDATSALSAWNSMLITRPGGPGSAPA